MDLIWISVLRFSEQSILQLDELYRSRTKYEIECIHGLSDDYLTEIYLRNKLVELQIIGDDEL